MEDDLFQWSDGLEKGDQLARVQSGMIRSVFMGWQRPMVALVADWLLARKVEMPSLLVIVPTAESGRRLRESLAERGGYLSPRFMTAGQFGRLLIPHQTQYELLEKRAWIATIGSFPWQEWEQVLPEPRDEMQRDELAQEMIALRRTLLEYNLGFSQVFRRLPPEHPDRLRWQMLARLEDGYIRRVQQWEECDVKRSQSELLIPYEVSSVIVAGVTDASEWAVRAMDQYAHTGGDLTVLVNAPENEREGFDHYGRPLTEFWESRHVNWAGGHEVHHFAVNAEALAEQALEQISRLDQRDLALSVADQELIPRVTRAFRQRNITVYNPAGRSLREWALTRWLKDWRAYSQHESVEHLRSLANSQYTYVLCSIESQLGQYETVYAMQTVLHETVTQTVNDLWYLQKAGGFKEKGRSRLNVALGRVLDFVSQLREARKRLRVVREVGDARGRSSFRELESFLEAVLVSEQGDRAEKVFELLEVLEDQLSVLPEREVVQVDLLAELIEMLESASVSDTRDGVHLEASGWMELGYESAETLLICGMNEGSVPNTDGSDYWLPESLREMLGMKTNRARYAHDVFYATSLIEARRERGGILTFATQYGAGGDPQMPSRLLLQCDDELFPARVAHCFSKDTFALVSPPWQREWVLHVPNAQPKESLGVTAFKDYLTCPFRFYLKHVLKMRRPSSETAEWDHREFGNLVHEVLEEMEGEDHVVTTRDRAVLQTWMSAKLDEIIARRLEHLPLALEIQRTSLQQRLGFYAHAEVMQREADAEEWETVAWEESIELELGGMMIRGKIDRVDQHRDGRYRLIDYKTGSVKPPAKEHIANVSQVPQHLAESPVTFSEGEKEYFWQNLQLPLYALAYQEKTGSFPEVAYCAIAESQEKTGYQFWTMSDAQASAARSALEYLVVQIQGGVFYPPVERGEREYDDYRELALGYTLEGAVEFQEEGGNDGE